MITGRVNRFDGLCDHVEPFCCHVNFPMAKINGQITEMATIHLNLSPHINSSKIENNIGFLFGPIRSFSFHIDYTFHRLDVLFSVLLICGIAMKQTPCSFYMQNSPLPQKKIPNTIQTQQLSFFS